MGIDWYKVKFLAVDGTRSVWTYATDHVGRDLRTLADELPKEPKSELVAAERGIAIIFHGPYAKIARTIDSIADKIVSEGMGRPHDTEKRKDAGHTDRPCADGARELREQPDDANDHLS